MSTEPFVREKIGRFFRKTDKLLGGVEIKPFDFDEICESDVLLMDNLKHTIIHAELHHPIALKKVVREHDKMNSDLRDPHQMAPTLVPIDFTGDWKREQERSHKRSKAKIDEDEAYELELEFRRRTEEISSGETPAGPIQEANPQEKEVQFQGKQPDQVLKNEPSKGGGIDSILSQSPESLAFDIQKFGLDRVGAEINKAKDHTGGEIDSTETSVQSQKQDLLSVKSPQNVPATSQSSGAQINSGIGNDPSYSASQQVQLPIFQQNQPQEVDPEMAERIYDDYKSQGFEDGFRVGEEKAIFQLKEKVEQINTGIASMAQEVTTLKKSVLQSVESHFVEIAQAISESLLGREFRINPAALSGMISKAIQDNVKDDVVKIHVNQESFDLLSSGHSSEINKFLNVDNSLTFGNFRVESQMSTLDGKVDKMVKDMLANISLDLTSQDDETEIKVAS